MFGEIYEQDKIFMGRLSYEADLLEEISNFCIENSIKTGWVSVIGATKDIKLGYYNQQKREYMTLSSEDIGGEKAYEIVSCSGNISIKENKPFAHLHILITDKDGKAYGGHLMPGTTIFAGEFMIQSLKGKELTRTFDETTGLSLWKNP